MICARPGSRKWRASGVSAYSEIHQDKHAFMPEWGGALRRKQSGVPTTLVGQSHERGPRHTRQALFLKETHRALFFVPAASHQRIASCSWFLPRTINSLPPVLGSCHEPSTVCLLFLVPATNHQQFASCSWFLPRTINSLPPVLGSCHEPSTVCLLFLVPATNHQLLNRNAD